MKMSHRVRKTLKTDHFSEPIPKERFGTMHRTVKVGTEVSCSSVVFAEEISALAALPLRLRTSHCIPQFALTATGAMIWPNVSLPSESVTTGVKRSDRGP